MPLYVVHRVVSGLVTLFGITLVSFGVIQLAPGDPAQLQTAQIADAAVSQRVYEQLRQLYGLDRPVHVQYGMWMSRLVRGDLGSSFHDGRRVSRKIGEALWPTLSVALLSLAATLVVALPLGILAAVRQGGPFDKVSSTLLYMLYSVPSYVMGMILILYLGVRLDLLPFRGMRSDHYAELSTWGQMWDLAKHYVMITFCFTFGNLAYYARFVRQNLLEVIRQDYVRTARAKGLPERTVILRHAFRNSLIPLISLIGLTFPFVLSGSVILEYMFNWPGLGRLYFESVLGRDYPTIMALNFITAVLVLVTTFVADMAYGWVDPRVSYER
ncbi:MAG TPA: ABC transporter permease [Thermoanaerobaculia bacterium]|nr:ABC transporter permease [Thermoanaerobaculia bacterium]